jgi:hypothetical protein
MRVSDHEFDAVSIPRECSRKPVVPHFGEIEFAVLRDRFVGTERFLRRR